MAFDYGAFASKEQALWADLMANELLHGPFKDPRIVFDSMYDFASLILGQPIAKFIQAGRSPGKSFINSYIRRSLTDSITAAPFLEMDTAEIEKRICGSDPTL